MKSVTGLRHYSRTGARMEFLMARFAGWIRAGDL